MDFEYAKYCLEDAKFEIDRAINNIEVLEEEALELTRDQDNYKEYSLPHDRIEDQMKISDLGDKIFDMEMNS